MASTVSYSYASNNPLNAADPLGLWTFQIGFAGSGVLPISGAFGIGGTVSTTVAIDGTGQVALVGTVGAGPAVGAGISGGITVQGSNADSVQDLGGLFVNGSISGGAGIGGSEDVFTGKGSQGQPVGGGGATIGAGFGAGAFVGVTNTAVITPSTRQGVGLPGNGIPSVGTNVVGTGQRMPGTSTGCAM